MPILFISLLFPLSSFAFLDFIGDQSKKATELAAYADAASELIEEISPNSDLKVGSREIKKRADRLRNSIHEVGSLSKATQSVLEGPDWSSKRLETNIRSTTNYLRRLTSLLVRVTALGTDGVIALNTTETNIALNEIQKNQQALIMQNSSHQIHNMEKEQEERRQWAQFSDQQKKLRRQEGKRGKL